MSGGEARDRLRQRVRDRLGAVEACLTDSGTTALGLALLAAKRLRSIPVALPAWSCFDVATAADAADVPVVLYDLDPLTLGPNFVSLERALDRGAKSVVVAHHYGVPVDVARAVVSDSNDWRWVSRGRVIVGRNFMNGSGARINVSFQSLRRIGANGDRYGAPSEVRCRK